MRLLLVLSLLLLAIRGQQPCTDYQVYGYGSCNDTTLAQIEKAAIEACQQSSDANGFSVALQANLDDEGFSTVAAYNADDVGFFICLGDPCYVLGSVGPVGLFGVFIGGPGPCDSVASLRKD